MLSSDRIRAALDKYGDMLLRNCVIMLRNQADAEDAVEDTFISYMQKAPQFTDSEHEKAWLIRVAANKCRDLLRYQKRHAAESDEVLQNYSIDSESTGILEALMELPEKYRLVLTLHYIDGYKVGEIADIADISSSAVKMRLARGRRLLEEKYRKGVIINDREEIKNCL